MTEPSPITPQELRAVAVALAHSYQPSMRHRAATVRAAADRIEELERQLTLKVFESRAPKGRKS